MQHVFLWISMMTAGFGLASFSLFLVRARKEREPWLRAGTWFTLFTVLHLIYLQAFFFCLVYLGMAPDEFSLRFPLAGMAGMGVAAFRTWLFLVFIRDGLSSASGRLFRRLCLGIVALLWAVQASYYVARMAGAEDTASLLWTFHQWAEVILAAAYTISIWGLVAWKKAGGKEAKDVLRFSCVVHLASAPLFVLSFITYMLAGAYFSNHFFFCLLSIVFFVGSFALNTKAIEGYRFPVPSALPDAMRTEYGLTEREAEIVSALLGDKRPAQIAAALFISIKTVNTHIQSVYRKCGISGRPALVDLTRKYATPGAPRPPG